MAFKKIKNSANTLTGLLISILLALGIFLVMYNYLNFHSGESGIPLGENYTNTLNSLNNSVDLLNGAVNDIKNGISGITEATDPFTFAINGFKGLGALLKLPLVFVTIMIQTYVALLATVQQTLGIPPWITVLFTIGLIGYAVFLILSILKGDQHKL